MKNKKTIIRIQDKYNMNKVWLIKKTKCNHYFMNQEINGIVFYPKYTKTTLKYILDILELKELPKAS